MKKNILVGLMCPVMAATAMVSPVLAVEAGPGPSTGSDGAALTTQVAYDVAETGWTFSVPATQKFTKTALLQNGDVQISPEAGVINLANNTKIEIAIKSAEGFLLVANTRNSQIPYIVSKTQAVADDFKTDGELEAANETGRLSNNNVVLTYVAGTDSNEGKGQTLYFATSQKSINEAKVVGAHTDQLTFTVSVGKQS